MLIPNNKQRSKMFKYANAARFTYNWALEKEQESYKNGRKFISDGKLRKEFTQLKKTQEKMPVMHIRDFSKDVQSFLNLKVVNIPHHLFIKIM